MKEKNRPELVDKLPRWALFTTAGQTGWHRRRDLGDYKGNRREGDFSHLHGKFWGEGDDPV
jgi:hypothetical protein